MKTKILALLTASALLIPLSPIAAQEGSSETVVGYTSSTTAEIPSGGNQNGKEPNTGDLTSLGSQMTMLGLSSFIILIVLMKKGKGDDKKTTEGL